MVVKRRRELFFIPVPFTKKPVSVGESRVFSGLLVDRYLKVLSDKTVAYGIINDIDSKGRPIISNKGEGDVLTGMQISGANITSRGILLGLPLRDKYFFEDDLGAEDQGPSLPPRARR